MKKEKDLFVAVLIDGDNASSEKMEDVMRFVSRYGTAVVRRIYGDWTKKKLSGWKDAARDYSFRMVQASSFVQGKNTTDIALVMDAMDILHEGGSVVFVWLPVTGIIPCWHNVSGRVA